MQNNTINQTYTPPPDTTFKCTLIPVHGVKYGNFILNDRDLFKYTSDTVGVLKVLNLGSKLGNELIEYYRFTENPDVILAGLISLED